MGDARATGLVSPSQVRAGMSHADEDLKEERAEVKEEEEELAGVGPGGSRSPPQDPKQRLLPPHHAAPPPPVGPTSDDDGAVTAEEGPDNSGTTARGAGADKDSMFRSALAKAVGR